MGKVHRESRRSIISALIIVEKEIQIEREIGLRKSPKSFTEKVGKSLAQFQSKIRKLSDFRKFSLSKIRESPVAIEKMVVFI
jgi:hypothetical protein